MNVATDTQVVRWRHGTGRWTYGRTAGARAGDGSVLVDECRSLADARGGVRSERSRAIRAHQLTVSVGDAWQSLVNEILEDDQPALPVDDQPVVPVVDRGDDDEWAVATWLLVRGSAVPHVDPLVFTLRELAGYAQVMTWSGWSPEFTGTASGSELVAALEQAYAVVRTSFPELPDAVIITGSGDAGGGWLKLGHFGRDRWSDAIASGRRPEMFLGGELLALGAVRTVRTLLHECAHALAHAREVDDTSRQGRYHNRKFVAIANELGLDYLHDEPHGTIGFSDVDFTPEGRARWSGVVEDLHRAITLSMGRPMLAGGLPGGPAGGGGHGFRTGRTKGTGGGSTVKISCPECGRIGRFSPAQLARGPIICGSDDHTPLTFEML